MLYFFLFAVIMSLPTEEDSADDVPSNPSQTQTTTALVCDLCDKLYPNTSKLNRHKQEVHVNRRFQCDHCPKDFRTKREMEHHSNKAHLGELNFLCEWCSRPFVDRLSLNRHVANIHAETKRVSHLNLSIYVCATAYEYVGFSLLFLQYTCQDCGKGFGYKSHYVEHCKRVHRKVCIKDRCHSNYYYVYTYVGIFLTVGREIDLWILCQVSLWQEISQKAHHEQAQEKWVQIHLRFMWQ